MIINLYKSCTSIYMNSNIEEQLNNGKVIFQKYIPAKETEYTNFPESLNIKIIKVLKNMKIEKLYTHI